MTEPARKLPLPFPESLGWSDEESPDFPRLHRWVGLPDGRAELLDVPLTPELFLCQELGDKIVQRNIHGVVSTDLYKLLCFRYRGQADVLILFDVHHVLGKGLRPVSPDISLTLGARPGDRESFDVEEEGVVPGLIIEVLSPDKKSIRDVDEKDKPWIYRRAGIAEYILVDPPRPRKPGFTVKGLRLGPKGWYRKIRPDSEGHILSETTGLLFPVSARGVERLILLDAKTRLPLPYHEDTEAAREAEAKGRRTAEEKAAWEATARRTAEEKAAREAIARRTAEAEIARLREELRRLKGEASS